MMKTDVYVGLGGNRGDTQSVFCQALRQLSQLQGISQLRMSRLYRTQPQDVPPQRDYLNAVCQFKTALSVEQLACALSTIELSLGKRAKPKDIPRVIDIDILFFGQEYHDTAELQIPHTRWRLRPFVLLPLMDLVSELTLPVRAGVWEPVVISDVLKDCAALSHLTVQPVSCRRDLTLFQQLRGNDETCSSQRLFHRGERTPHDLCGAVRH
jgi:2-amino-4-hydroxy-6-hydroxymethyldihydropteridine diphosphokinase